MYFWCVYCEDWHDKYTEIEEENGITRYTKQVRTYDKSRLHENVSTKSYSLNKYVHEHNHNMQKDV